MRIEPDQLEHEISRVLAQHAELTNAVKFTAAESDDSTLALKFTVEVFLPNM